MSFVFKTMSLVLVAFALLASANLAAGAQAADNPGGPAPVVVKGSTAQTISQAREECVSSGGQWTEQEASFLLQVAGVRITASCTKNPCTFVKIRIPFFDGDLYKRTCDKVVTHYWFA